MPDPLAELSTAARHLKKWTDRRDEAIRAAREQGASLRVIADAADVTHQTVANILARTD